MELFDVLDCRGAKTGDTIPRDEAHRTGVWHGAFHGLIIYRRDGRGYALFQKRSRSKKIAPGRYDVSVGGHYSTGENASVAGPREILEEIGLEVRFEDMVPLGRRIFVYCFEPGVQEYEFQDVFLLPRDIRQEDIVLQREEVDGMLELEIGSGIGLFTAQVPVVEGRLMRGGIAEEKVDVRAGDFVPCLDNYYLKLLTLAKRYLGGERIGLVI